MLFSRHCSYTVNNWDSVYVIIAVQLVHVYTAQCFFQDFMQGGQTNVRRIIEGA